MSVNARDSFLKKIYKPDFNGFFMRTSYSSQGLKGVLSAVVIGGTLLTGEGCCPVKEYREPAVYGPVGFLIEVDKKLKEDLKREYPEAIIINDRPGHLEFIVIDKPEEKR